MTQDFFLAQFKLWLMAAIAYAGGAGWISGPDAGFATVTATTFGPMIALALWAAYAKWNTKAVPSNSTAISITNSEGNITPMRPGLIVPVMTTAGRVVGALLLGILILQASPSFAQALGNSCDPTVILKGPLTFQTFVTKLKQCGTDDIAAAIKDAQSQIPADNAALACLLPVQAIAAGAQSGGLVLQFQLFRDAKRAGLVTGCTNYINSTLVAP
jgi:hypothetical protein